MPIQVEDFAWSQSAKVVQINVPLKGVPANKVDIFSTDRYIKASYAPYIFEVFLNAPVDDSRSKAVIKNGQIHFELQKRDTESTWSLLQHEKHKDKEFMQIERQDAVSFAQQKAQEEAERRAKERDQQQKYTVKQQLLVEQEERQRIKEIQDSASNEAMRDLERWKTSQEKDKVKQDVEQISSSNKDESRGVETSAERDQQNTPIMEDKTNCGKIFEANAMPAPRAAGTIQLHFTPRAFVTPSRESKAPEEEAWLEKVAEMKKIKPNTESKEDLEDMNPVWLKEKGNDFYKKGNFIAAVNAFTAAIAYNLLDPPVAANAKSRCIALVRRGTAHFQRENLVEALSDYEAALKIDPANQSVKEDAEKIRRIILGSNLTE
eukprot:gene5280-5948_t